MRTQRQGGAYVRACGGGLGIAVLALALVLLVALASTASAAPRVRHSCHAPSSPRAARCLAMRLLVEQPAAAQALSTARAGSSASPASKPFPGFQTPQPLPQA